MKKCTFRWLVAVMTLIAATGVLIGCKKGSSSMFFPMGGGGTANWCNWITDGSVRSIATSGSTIYFGGNFTQVWANSGGGAVVDTDSGMIPAKSRVLYVNARVKVAAPDGKGGWYIGGQFTKIGNATRNLVAHIKSDGSLDTVWAPSVTGAGPAVNAIAVSGEYVYIGGSFTTINGVAGYNCIARIGKDGVVDSTWDPDVSGVVNALAATNNAIFVGGTFIQIGSNELGQYHLAALNVANDQARTDWNPDMALISSVNALAVNGTTLYVGGVFSAIGSNATQPTRNNIAALSTADASATAWDPNANLPVSAIAVMGNTVFAGGSFTSIGGTSSINGFAALNANVITNNFAFTANPALGIGSSVSSIAVSSSAIYFGGSFTGNYDYAGAIDPGTGMKIDWAPEPDNAVSALAVSGGRVYVGGVFDGICYRDRSYIAAVNGSTGLITDWSPDITGGDVEAITVADGVVYAGGGFDSIGGSTRNYLGGIDAKTGDVTAFDPNMDNYVYVLKAYKGRLYVGGDFSEYLTCYDLDTGTVLAGWTSPTLDDSVNVVEINNGVVYAGGNFGMVNGSAAHQFLAAFSADDGSRDNSFTPMSALSAGSVYSLAFSNKLLYTGGQFDGTVGGSPRTNLAVLSTVDATSASWQPDPNGDVYALSLLGKTLYAGGGFTSAGSVVSSGTLVAAISTEDGLASSTWKPYVDGTIYTLKSYSNVVLVGGSFTTVNGSFGYGNIVAIDTETGLPYGY